MYFQIENRINIERKMEVSCFIIGEVVFFFKYIKKGILECCMIGIKSFSMF